MHSQDAQALLGDRIILACIALSALAAVAIGAGYVDSALAWGVSALLLAVSLGIYAVAKATLLSRMVLAFNFMGFVVLHIQLAQGTTMYHFGVFTTLALLLVYLDWRPILLAAAAIAVHHVAFDRLQAAGWGLYCLTQPDFGTVVSVFQSLHGSAATRAVPIARPTTMPTTRMASKAATGGAAPPRAALQTQANAPALTSNEGADWDSF